MSKKGKPRIKSEDQKNVKIQIRTTADQRTNLKKKAKKTGRSLSEFLLEGAERTKTWTAGDRKTIKQQIKALNDIGNNLNQTTHWCNTYKSNADAIYVLPVLVSIERELREALKEQKNAY